MKMEAEETMTMDEVYAEVLNNLILLTNKSIGEKKLTRYNVGLYNSLIQMSKEQKANKYDYIEDKKIRLKKILAERRNRRNKVSADIVRNHLSILEKKI